MLRNILNDMKKSLLLSKNKNITILELSKQIEIGRIMKLECNHPTLNALIYNNEYLPHLPK